MIFFFEWMNRDEQRQRSFCLIVPLKPAIPKTPPYSIFMDVSKTKNCLLVECIACVYFAAGTAFLRETVSFSICTLQPWFAHETANPKVVYDPK